jgi:hypothetical protein
MGLTGGVEVTRLTSNTFLVSVRGNGFTRPETVTKYALRKAAEETVASGQEWFVIGDATDTTRTATVVSPGSSQSYTTASATAYGNTAWGSATTNTYSSPTTVNTIIKPGAVVRVTSGNGPPPPGAYSAKEVLSFLAPSQ